MALTKVSGSILKDPLNLGGEVSIGGTLTYQDVTNVDAIGIITARAGINVSGGQLDVGSNVKIGNAGVATATNFKTGSSNLHSTGLTVGNNFLHSTGINVGTGATIHVPATNTLTLGTNSNETVRITSDGFVGINDIEPKNGLSIATLGDYTNNDGNTYYMPVGKWASVWNGINALQDNTDYWVGFNGGYLKTGNSVNISLAPNRGNINSQDGMYVSGEATSNSTSDFAVGKIMGGSSTGQGTSGNVRATKSELFRIKSDGKVGIGITAPARTLDILNASANADIRLRTTANSFNSFIIDSNRSANTQFAVIDGNWNGTVVDRIQFVTGSDGTNKDDGYMAFHTRTSGASLTERLRITTHGGTVVSKGGSPNTASGWAGLEVKAGSSEHQLVLSSTATASNSNYSKLGFKLHPSNDNERVKAAIVCQGSGGGYGEASRMMFCLDNVADNGSAEANGADERLRISNTGMITLGTPTNTVLKAEVCNAVNGHYFVSQCDDNSNGFEIYQKHGSTSTRNTFAVYANTGGGASKLSQFIISGDNNAYFRGNVMPEADNDVDMGSDARTWRQLHYLNGYPGRGTQQVTSISSSSSSSWYNVGYSRGSMGGLDTNGVYIITLFADTWAAGGGNYSCNYTWIMGMRNQSTNQTSSFNIPLLSVTGHSTNGVLFELRTTRQASVHGADEYLQWRCTNNLSAINNSSGRIMKWDIQRIGRSAP